MTEEVLKQFGVRHPKRAPRQFRLSLGVAITALGAALLVARLATAIAVPVD